jgi:hypothetical protein
MNRDSPDKPEAGKPFVSRVELMKTIKFPANCAELVVIPSNEKGTGFLRTCYEAEILEGILTLEEFQSVIDNAAKVVAKIYSKKRIADNSGIDSFKIIIFVIVAILAGVFLGMIFYAVENDDSQLEVIAYCFIMGSFILIIPLSIHECCRKSSSRFVSFI